MGLGRRVRQPLRTQQRRHRSHHRPVHDHVGVAAGRRRAVERPAAQPLAAHLHAAAHPARVHAAEACPTLRPPLRQYGVVSMKLTPTMSEPADAFGAHDRVDAGAANGLADVARRADAELDRQARRADDHVDAVLEIAARQRVVLAVANQRRTEKPDVGVVAGGVDAKRRAVAAALHRAHPPPGREEVLAVGLDDLEAALVGIGGAEDVGLARRSSARPTRLRAGTAGPPRFRPSTRTCVPAPAMSSVETPTLWLTSTATVLAVRRAARASRQHERDTRRPARHGQRISTAPAGLDDHGARRGLAAGPPRAIRVGAARARQPSRTGPGCRRPRSRRSPRPARRPPCSGGCCRRCGSGRAGQTSPSWRCRPGTGRGRTACRRGTRTRCGRRGRCWASPPGCPTRTASTCGLNWSWRWSRTIFAVGAGDRLRSPRARRRRLSAAGR